MKKVGIASELPSAFHTVFSAAAFPQEHFLQRQSLRSSSFGNSLPWFQWTSVRVPSLPPTVCPALPSLCVPSGHLMVQMGVKAGLLMLSFKIFYPFRVVSKVCLFV